MITEQNCQVYLSVEEIAYDISIGHLVDIPVTYCLSEGDN